MKTPKLTLLALWIAGSFLAACDSGGSSTSENPNTPGNPHPGSAHDANGTLKVDGKSFPAFASAIYDDTSMSLSVVTDIDNNDTGWILFLPAKPGKGVNAFPRAEPGIDAAYHPSGGGPRCSYTAKSGNLTFTAWDATAAGPSGGANVSGSASLVMGPYSSTSTCPNATLELTFANAEALVFK